MRDDACLVIELEHTAEIGLQVRAADAASLFACMGEAMFNLIGLSPHQAGTGTPHTITVSAPDVETLLVDWLNELAYLYEIGGEVIRIARITAWSPTEIQAELVGYPSTTAPSMHIKAVTYHDLAVGLDAGGWSARVFFDI